MKLVRLINMCLNETYSRFRVGKHFPDIFPIKNVLVYAIRRIQVNQKALKLNGTNQLLFYADDVNVVCGSVHTIKKNTDVSLLLVRRLD
jgi:hypothetical protein